MLQQCVNFPSFVAYNTMASIFTESLHDELPPDEVELKDDNDIDSIASWTSEESDVINRVANDLSNITPLQVSRDNTKVSLYFITYRIFAVVSR